MDMSLHRFTDLFAQLGLASDEASIRGFITAHANNAHVPAAKR
jgi:hypothetical protein